MSEERATHEQAVSDPANEHAIAESDYTGTGPNESIPCFFNALFYVQAKLKEAVGVEKTQERKESYREGEEEKEEDDTLLREGLRYLVRMMCCASAEQFGLPLRNLFESLLPTATEAKLPFSYQYVRALGSGVSCGGGARRS